LANVRGLHQQHQSTKGNDMARKRGDIAEVAVTTQDGQPFDLTGLETAEELNPALEAIYAEMGTDKFGKIKLYIYKIIAETGKEARVWEGVPGDYDLMSVAKRFGSSDYRVKLYVPHSSGRIVVGANTVFTILLDPAEDARIVQMREGMPMLPQQAQQSMTPEQIAVIVVQAVKAAMPAPVDSLAQMDRLAGVMQKLLPDRQPAAPQGNSFTEILGAAKSLLELTRGMGTPVDGEGNVDTKGLAIARGVDLLTKMFEKSIQSAGANPGAVVPKSNGGTLPAQVAQQAAQGEIQLTAEQTEELEMLRLQLKMVNRKAAENVDPVELTASYYEDLPDAIFDTVVFNPKWFEVLCSNVPECEQHAEWYARLRAAIIAKGIKEQDLKSLPDGSIVYNDEPEQVETNGAVNA
jgi:hypothetical protein